MAGIADDQPITDAERLACIAQGKRLAEIALPRQLDMVSGLKVIEETEGTGAAAQKGDTLTFDCAAFLNKGSVRTSVKRSASFSWLATGDRGR